MEEKKVANETAVDVAVGDLETQGFSATSTKTLLRKLDWHIIPFMSLIYLYVLLLSSILSLYLLTRV